MATSQLSRRGFLGKGLMATALAAAKPLLARAGTDLAARQMPPADTENADKKPVLLLISSTQASALEVKVRELLKSKMHVVAPKEPCGNTMDIMRKMPEWMKTYKPDIVHFSTGYEDIRSMYYGTYEHLIPRRLYKRNAHQILDFVYGLSDKAVPIWATMPPVNDEWIESHKSKVRDWTFFQDDVETFNKEAIKVCKKMNVKVNDINRIFLRSGPDGFLDKNGYELNAKGINVVAQNIALQVDGLL